MSMLERNPGATEASVRAELRAVLGGSSALDIAVEDGVVIRNGNKLYRREDAP